MFKLSCLLLVVALVHGLVDEPAPPDYEALQVELDENRALWESSVGRAYEMTITRSCFCLVESLGPFTLTIVDDTIESVEPDNGFTDGLPTINGIFDFLQDAIDNEAVVITVSYDSTLGYPTDSFVDRDFQIADEELGYSDVVVTLLPDPTPSPTVCNPPRVNVIALARRLTPKSRSNGFAFFDQVRALRNWVRYLESVGCDYEYTLGRSCFCLSPDFTGPFIITVVDSAISSAVFEIDGTPVPNPSELPTITELFDIIFDEAMEADAVDIDYDSTTGVPTRAFIDRIELAIDDEITYTAVLS